MGDFLVNLEHHFNITQFFEIEVSLSCNVISNSALRAVNSLFFLVRAASATTEPEPESNTLPVRAKEGLSGIGDTLVFWGDEHSAGRDVTVPGDMGRGATGRCATGRAELVPPPPFHFDCK